MDTKRMIYVWDIFVRIFHWSLVLFFAIAYFSGEEESMLHIYSGYVVFGLIIFRILWGFIGSKYARFNNFLYPFAKVISYIKSSLTKNPERYIGHNPAGGWMIMALLLSLLMVTVSGFKLYAVDENKGPLASSNHVILIEKAYADDYKDEKSNRKENNGEEFWEEIHEATANLTLFLIFLHIAGVVVSSRLHKENLVKSMITGKKDAL